MITVVFDYTFVNTYIKIYMNMSAQVIIIK